MIRIITIILLSYIAFLLYIYFFQSKMVFFPLKKIDYTPNDIGLKYEEIIFESFDKTRLYGWFIPAKNAKATILFLHGNAGNISHRLESIKIFNKLGLNVFIFDYRGYGKSEGKINEKNCYKDASSAYKYLLENKSLKEKDIIIFGRSLGGSIAAYLASKTKSKALIIESTFTSAKELAKDIYSFLIPSFVIRYSFNTAKYLKNVKSPVLIIHSKDDEIISFKHGKTLYEIANEPKKMLVIKGDHNYGFVLSKDIYIKGLEEFLKDIL